jgi:phosphatidylglycerol:prolipoprotein diacylglycerol transferase
MYFPADSLGALRHPSQLYEAFLEGVALYVVIGLLRKKASFSGYIFALYIMGYGIARFLIEFTREPDPQMGFILGPLTMGQVLCIGMIIAGSVIMVARRKAGQPADVQVKKKRKKGE